ncbi:RidA family protein [Parapedobacter soli]|uniref:RidA family protein n=1 Tax=Parapedobacter soli TaxID=416955 RepID=UPI0021C91ED7|nr:RidA family protein [Parapedobacter soli]
MKQVIASNDAPAAIGPYSQAIRHGNLVFLSGQLPIDATDGSVPDDIQAQTRQSLENMRHVLAATGCTMDDVVKTTCYLADMELFQEMNEVYRSFFGSAPPARTTIAAKGLPRGVLVEIDCMAVHTDE